MLLMSDAFSVLLMPFLCFTYKACRTCSFVVIPTSAIPTQSSMLYIADCVFADFPLDIQMVKWFRLPVRPLVEGSRHVVPTKAIPTVVFLCSARILDEPERCLLALLFFPVIVRVCLTTLQVGPLN
jgi:hypothetical protein